MSSPLKLSPVGEMVDVGGFRLHAVARGQGAPAVIFEPGLGGMALQYALIQSRVCAFTRTLDYDRAGQGWSDVSPNPRTPENMAGELKTLLDRLDFKPPYILVGHSFGGLLARFYTGFHPDEVAGLVLVDSSDVQQYDTFSNLDQLTRQTAAGVRLLKILSKIGLGKWLTRLSMGSAVKGLPKELIEPFLELASQPKHNETVLAEFSQHRYYFGRTSQVPATIGDTPLVVVTAANSVSGKAKFGGMTADQLNELHQQWQAELVKISTRGEHIVVPGATHLSILLQPEHSTYVAEAIRRMVDQTRMEAQC